MDSSGLGTDPPPKSLFSHTRKISAGKSVGFAVGELISGSNKPKSDTFDRSFSRLFDKDRRELRVFTGRDPVYRRLGPAQVVRKIPLIPEPSGNGTSPLVPLVALSC